MTRANIAGDVPAHRSSSIVGATGHPAFSGRSILLATIVGCGAFWVFAICWLF